MSLKCPYNKYQNNFPKSTPQSINTSHLCGNAVHIDKFSLSILRSLSILFPFRCFHSVYGPSGSCHLFIVKGKIDPMPKLPSLWLFSQRRIVYHTEFLLSFDHFLQPETILSHMKFLLSRLTSLNEESLVHIARVVDPSRPSFRSLANKTRLLRQKYVLISSCLSINWQLIIDLEVDKDSTGRLGILMTMVMMAMLKMVVVICWLWLWW